ncbi:MAG: DNA-3-methyladenine glycosylase [Fusobacteriota bacterium]
MNFFEGDTKKIAKTLLGSYLVRKLNGQKIIAKIVDVECYIGPEDKASHAHGNKKTKRTKSMFLPGGCSYIYLIYGMYYCFNVVTGKKGFPAAILIRGVEPVKGLDIIKENRNIKSKKLADLTNGPGKLCQALKIDKNLNEIDLTDTNNDIYIKINDSTEAIEKSTRINIDYAKEFKDKLWRFHIKDNPFISK